MKISDEMREWCKWCKEHSAVRDSLCRLADRVDAEMVELPKDADGVPVHVGDTVEFTGHGGQYAVRSITLHTGGAVKVDVFNDGCRASVSPTCLIHIHPDSWERIASDMEDFAADNEINGSHEVLDRAMDFADRIRKLAEKEDGHGND